MLENATKIRVTELVSMPPKLTPQMYQIMKACGVTDPNSTYEAVLNAWATDVRNGKVDFTA